MISQILGRFALFFACALLHEVGHVLMAIVVGAPTKRIHLTLLGTIGHIPTFNKLSDTRQMLILLAGPGVSLVLFLLWRSQPFLAEVNLLLLVFNLLPIRPLDGGELFFIITSRFTGAINANHLLKKSADLCVVLIFLAGLIQVYLYPFNVSLILLAVYLKKRANYCYQQTYRQFFRQLSQRF